MSPPSTVYSVNIADPERPHRGMKQSADASGGKEAAAALNQSAEVAKRLQVIFDGTKGDPGIAESLAKTRDAAGNLARGFGDMAGPGWGAVNAPNDAQRAGDQSSQPLPEDPNRLAKPPDGTRLAAAMAAAEPADRRATGPEPAGRDAAAKRLERRSRFGIGKDKHPEEEAKGKLPAAPLGPSEATSVAPEKPRPPTDAAQAAARANPLGAPGASGDLESRFGIGIRAEAGERTGARNRAGPASTQQEREPIPALDPVEPAIKALLSEVARMQDQRMHGLRQAVEVIATHSEAMDGLIQFMQTIAAHQEQLRADVTAHGEQLAAWARTTQIP